MNTRTRLSRSGRALAARAAIGLCILSAAAHVPPGHASRNVDGLPPTVQITCPAPSPLVVFVALPTFRVHWEGHDPDAPGAGLPAQYKFILLGPSSEFPVSLALANPDSLRRYYVQHPLGPWAGWDSTGSDNPSAEFTNLAPNEQYLFAVIALDESGNYSQPFSLSTNLLRFTVSLAGHEGPVLTLTGPGLDYRYPSGGYCPCPSAEVPVEIEERRSTTFGWFAEAFTTCDSERVAWYRWALDIEDVTDQTPRVDEQTDLRHWSAPSGATTATLPPFLLSHPPTPEVHRFYVEAQDRIGFRSLGIIRITVVPSTNRPPECRAATADPPSLWPPDHGYVGVRIGGVSDPDGDPVAIRITRVTQDEPISGRGQGRAATTCADAIIDPDGSLKLRAERGEGGNGRVYTVWFTASDGQGGTCAGSAQVCVPHDQRHVACVDDGRTFDSLGPCDGRHQEEAQSLSLGIVSDPATGRGVATLEYSLSVASEVLVAVYDVTGRRVMTVANEFQAAGLHRTTWNRAGLAQGMYFVRLRTPTVNVTRPLLILR